jgi:hypothetical protein
MAFRPKSVFETIMYEYAKLIADRAIDERDSSAPAARNGAAYWSFVAHTFRRLNAGQMAPSAVLRENKLLMRAGAVCAYCDAAEQLQWEHIIPISRGGPDNIDNMVLACAACNRSKSARNPLEWYAARGLGRRDVPRLVMGKLLKVVLEEHRLRGTDQASEFPEGQELHLTGVCLVFEKTRGMPT